MKKTYDVLVIGPVSLDHNIDYQGNERKEVGGAVVASGFAAAKSGNRTAVFTKLNPRGCGCGGAVRRVRCGCVLEAVSGHLLHPQPVFHRRQRKAGLHLHGGVRSLSVR